MHLVSRCALLFSIDTLCALLIRERPFASPRLRTLRTERRAHMRESTARSSSSPPPSARLSRASMASSNSVVSTVGPRDAARCVEHTRVEHLARFISASLSTKHVGEQAVCAQAYPVSLGEGCAAPFHGLAEELLGLVELAHVMQESCGVVGCEV